MRVYVGWGMRVHVGLGWGCGVCAWYRGMGVSMGCGGGGNYINRADVTKQLLTQGKITWSSMEYMYTPNEERRQNLS